MIKNAKLTADTRNSIIFQLTTNACNTKRSPEFISFRKYEIEVCMKFLDNRTSSEHSNVGHAISIDDSRTIKEVKERLKKASTTKEANITIDEALAAVREVEIAPEQGAKKVVTLMLRKKVYNDGQYIDANRMKTEDMKMRTRCMACGEKGN